MKKILLLKLDNEENPKPINGLNNFNKIANEFGLEVSTLKFRSSSGNKIDEAHLYAQIDASDGFLIHHANLLSDKNIREAVSYRLKEGAIAYAELPEPRDTQTDGDLFFEDLGLVVTSIRAVAKKNSSVISQIDPSSIEFRRNGYEYGVRDFNLFEGISILTLSQPNGLGCYGGAKAVLSFPINEIDLVEMRKDRFVNGLSRPEFSVIGISSKEDWRGRVIASSSSLIYDSFSNVFGRVVPGIDSNDNKKFARNLIRMISVGPQSPGLSWQSAYALISEIEISCLRITEQVLRKKYSENWFQMGCPDGIKEKCLARARDCSPGVPIFAFLDLIDFKNIWRNNWDDFSLVFDSTHGSGVGRNRFLKFFQDINEIRKIVAHPVRQSHSEFILPSDEQMHLLKNTLKILKNQKINYG
jgi:hypothetical protein